MVRSDTRWSVSAGNGGWVRVTQTTDQHQTAVLIHAAPGDSGRLRIVELYLGDGEPITADALRRLRLGAIEQVINLPEARADIMNRLNLPAIDVHRLTEGYATSYHSKVTIGRLLDNSGLPREVVKQVAPKVRAQPVLSDEQRAAGRIAHARQTLEHRTQQRVPLRRPPGRKLPAKFFRDVAGAYRAAVRCGQPPAPFIAAEAQVPQTTAARWIKLARAYGYLGEGQRGRAGEAGELKLRYVGPIDTVEVPLPDGRQLVVKRGQEVRIPIDYALAMLEQETNWQPVGRVSDVD